MKIPFFRKRQEQRNVNPFDGPGWRHPFIADASPAAENLSTVFACVSAVSSAVSALPALVYQNEGKTRSEVNSGAIPELIRNGPNPWQTWPEFVEMLVAQTLLRGNGLVEIESSRAGEVIGLRVIPWDWCGVQMLPNGRLVYDVFERPGVYAPAQGKRRRLLQGDVIHIRDRSDDGIIGRSRLQRAAAVLHEAHAIFALTRNYYSNGMFPSLALTSAGTVSPDQQRQIQGMFNFQAGGAGKAGKVLVIPPDFKIERLSVSPEDAELLGSRRFETEEICRVFQVPPPIIQDYSHNTFTNSEQAGRWFAQFCLLPWVRKFETSFNRALFPGGEHELALDMSSFDRGDPTTRWQAHAIAASNQILTVDEIREVEGWGPKPVHQSTSACTSNDS